MALVHADDELAAGAPDERLRWPPRRPVRWPGRGSPAACARTRRRRSRRPPRAARFTAFRTSTSPVRARPGATRQGRGRCHVQGRGAAQARNSASSRLPNNPFLFSMPSSMATPASPTQGPRRPRRTPSSPSGRWSAPLAVEGWAQFLHKDPIVHPRRAGGATHPSRSDIHPCPRSSCWRAPGVAISARR